MCYVTGSKNYVYKTCFSSKTNSVEYTDLVRIY